MLKKKTKRPQHSKRERNYSLNSHWKNNLMEREINKYMGLPEDFEGSIKGIDKTASRVVKIFNATKLENAPEDKGIYSP